MPETSERTALYRLYAEVQTANPPPIIDSIYPKRMDSWRYLGTAGSCPRGGPGIYYKTLEREFGSCVVRAIEVEWDGLSAEVPIALYRLYDAEGTLLYVGISTNPKKRFIQHALFKPWWPSVARTSVSWLEVTRPEALAIEAAAIRDEEPLHNGKHNGVPAPFSPDEWPTVSAPVRQKADTLADLIRAEIASGRWQAGMRVPDREEMANASGVGVGTVDRAYQRLKDEGTLRSRMGTGTFVAKRPQ
ncbi:GntR family transcriptional regulator [Streptomyces sp. NPDC001634]|uniref:GntR family transcriptional regulator n=1 Tax=Streptomyces sp. NPDC001634 TaxID=3154390 RepID=UPI003318AE69